MLGLSGCGRRARPHVVPDNLPGRRGSYSSFKALRRMRYTERVRFQENSVGHECDALRFEGHWVAVPFARNPLWARLGAVFDAENFLYPCPPADIGRVEIDTSGLEDVRVLRCPIKRAGSDTVMLPRELRPLTPLVRHVCELEAHVNPSFRDFWCHITFERTRVNAGSTQRVGGWHVDGFQGVRVPRHRAEHSYLWADRQAVECCVQPFFVSHLDPARHNLFDELSRQAHEENAYAGLENHLYLIDPYVVHRTPVMQEDGWRSFVRITVAETELEDPTNTRNLSLDAAQHYEARIDVRDRLHAYRGEPPWENYGIRPATRPSGP